jgi:hypothetical protein
LLDGGLDGYLAAAAANGDRAARKQLSVAVGTFIPYTPGRSNSPGWVIAENGCHIWVGRRSSSGYAQAWDPERRVGRPVYRIRYEREIGPIPEGMVLDHYVCNNGAGGCCNPHHCRPATPRENALRASSITAAFLARTHCPAGHELAGDNLEPAEQRKGRRRCRICRATKQRAQRQARAGAR